jgi:hypothetical protein
MRDQEMNFTASSRLLYAAAWTVAFLELGQGWEFFDPEFLHDPFVAVTIKKDQTGICPVRAFSISEASLPVVHLCLKRRKP